MDNELHGAAVTTVRRVGDRVLVGLADGRVGALWLSSCGWVWDEGALDTGARFDIALPPSPRNLIGPYRVQVDVALDVADLDDVELRLVDVVVLSRTKAAPERVAFAEAHLLVYDSMR